MAKLIYEQKVEIYQKRLKGASIKTLSLEYGITKKNINYLCKLIELHGEGILRLNTNRKYSSQLKTEIINKVLVDNQAVLTTALEYGLSSDGMLENWIKSYKENGYVIIERKRGRSPTMKTNQPDKKYEDMTLEEKNAYNEKRIQYLEAENEYLKKLRAVVQARKNQQPKKK